MNQDLFREKLLSYLFYYSNWLETSTAGPFFCAWSLAVEEQFYLRFAFLLVLLPRRWLLALVSGLYRRFELPIITYTSDASRPLPPRCFSPPNAEPVDPRNLAGSF